MNEMNINERTYNVFVEGTKMHDTAKSIIQFLSTKRFDETKLTLDDFIKEIQNNVWRLFGIGITVSQGASINQRCEELMEQLINHKLIMTNY